MAKLPYMQFFVADYLSDPCLSVCSPTTRGIWIDILCNMHKLDRTGELSGTRESLARLTRCSLKELDVALRELSSSKTAVIETQKMLHVTPCNEVVTVKNRRMQREYKERINSTLRVKRHRVKRQCNSTVTPYLQNHSIDSEIESKENTKENSGFLFPKKFQNEKFKEAWKSWVEYFKVKYFDLITQGQADLIFKKLMAHNNETAIAMIEQAMEKGWKHCTYELKEEETKAENGGYVSDEELDKIEGDV